MEIKILEKKIEKLEKEIIHIKEIMRDNKIVGI
jgi:hypothetical protein